MIAEDGKHYDTDTWYPLPFIVNGRSMIPTMSEAHLLFILLADGRVWPWKPFYLPEDGKHVRTATHWSVRREGWFEI